MQAFAVISKSFPYSDVEYKAPVSTGESVASVYPYRYQADQEMGRISEYGILQREGDTFLQDNGNGYLFEYSIKPCTVTL